MSLNADRLIAIAMLAFSVGYGYLAITHPLLPFETRQPFKPNTLPMALAVIAGVLSLAVLLFESHEELAEEAREWRTFDWRTTIILVGLMVAYALLLRPAGYILATSGFVILSGILLGEKNRVLLCVIAIIMAGATWYLVQQVLGIFLVPLPAIFGG